MITTTKAATKPASVFSGWTCGLHGVAASQAEASALAYIGSRLNVGVTPASVQVPAPEQLQQLGHDSLQFTLVDCPGHASLIRTIIGGAQIIDTMILVIDVTKGKP